MLVVDVVVVLVVVLVVDAGTEEVLEGAGVVAPESGDAAEDPLHPTVAARSAPTRSAVLRTAIASRRYARIPPIHPGPRSADAHGGGAVRLR